MNEYDLYKRYISGEKLAGWSNFNEAGKILDNFIKSSVTEGFTIFVSHDIITMFYMYYKTGKSFEQADWLGFLDGICLNF